jgi:hypothetical protein
MARVVTRLARTLIPPIKTQAAFGLAVGRQQRCAGPNGQAIVSTTTRASPWALNAKLAVGFKCAIASP